MGSAVIMVSLLVLVSILFTGTARGCHTVSRCDGDGWFKYNDRQCVKFIEELKTWPEAQENCHQLDANLVTTQDIWQKRYWICFILLTGNTYDDVWIGLKRSGGVFKSIDGSEPSVTYWAPGEPNNPSGNKDCVSLSRRRIASWVSNVCSDKKKSVCVKKK